MEKKSVLRSVLVALSVTCALVLPFTTGCSSESAGSADTASMPTEESSTFPVTVTDDIGRVVTLYEMPQRIVSLAPANTEIVYALGSMDRLVGVTTYDDYPPEVADIPKMGDFVTPNLEAIADSDADLVLATSGVQGEMVTKLEELGAVVLVVDPATIEGLYTSIEMVGAALGSSEPAADLVVDMRSELADIEAVVGSLERVTCFVEIAQEPLFTVGSGVLIDELIDAAGGENVVTVEGYVGYSAEQLLTDDPSVYLVTQGSMSDPNELGQRPGFDGLTAVVDGRVHVLDDNLVSRPGPRVIQGIRQIAEALHPDAF